MPSSSSEILLLLVVVGVLAFLIMHQRHSVRPERFATTCTCTDSVTGEVTTTVQNTGPNATSSGYKEVMYPGDRLRVGQTLVSPSGNYTLTLADTGLILVNADGRVTWSAGQGATGIGTFEMQSDGNAVIYNTLYKPVWATGTNYQAGSFFKGFVSDEPKYLAMQDDGNLVVYGVKTRKPWWAIW